MQAVLVRMKKDIRKANPPFRAVLRLFKARGIELTEREDCLDETAFL